MIRTSLANPLLVVCCLLGQGLFVGRLAIADDAGRGNGKMVRLVEPVAQGADGSVVQVLSGGRPVALGTIVAADGYVLTKRSELSGDPIRVRLADNRLFPARVAAVRRRNDLALLYVDAGVPMKPLTFSNRVPPIATFLFSPDRRGRPIGIGVVGTKPRRVDDQGRLGVVLRDDQRGRARVDEVEPRSGADRAGIRPGDLIVGVNGSTANRHGVQERLKLMYPGDRVRLTILRPDDEESTRLSTLEIDARIMEYALMMETDSDVRVNGPRNARLSGFDSVIQHDTVLDPDECGGPILDSAGRAVGINIARAGRVVTYAIPSSLLNNEIDSMLAEARAGNEQAADSRGQ